MRRDLMDILACPVCKSPLLLAAEPEDVDDIVTGTLRCPDCPQTYPIVDGIPNLLPPSMRQ
ncbi:MAG: methytransferase partner Trm112 [Chloroflexota bacterium]|nr:methytransferase partner Trm112 [Chloroflexota bacterium]MDE2968645.1 methytransferase partner Trm112 [Chloroflexota bacterium]